MNWFKRLGCYLGIHYYPGPFGDSACAWCGGITESSYGD